MSAERLTDEQILVAKGRVIEDYVNCKQKLALQKSEERRARHFLWAICDFLEGKPSHLLFKNTYVLTDPVGMEAKEVLSPRLIELLNDRIETDARLKVLTKTLADMGLEVAE